MGSLQDFMRMQTIMQHPLSRFIERIGTRVYRNAGTCDCNTCRDVERDGLIIDSEQHANYLHSCQSNRGTDWLPTVWCEYYDDKEGLIKCDSCWEYVHEDDIRVRMEWPNICDLCKD